MGMLLRRHNIPLGNIVERVSEVAPSPNIVEKVIVEKTTTNYTKTDIKRMPLDDLKALATENGVVGADDMTGGELKQVLIKKFGL
jgi:hypothetical protein